jgi:hypothetical protein
MGLLVLGVREVGDQGGRGTASASEYQTVQIFVLFCSISVRGELLAQQATSHTVSLQHLHASEERSSKG